MNGRTHRVTATQADEPSLGTKSCLATVHEDEQTNLAFLPRDQNLLQVESAECILSSDASCSTKQYLISNKLGGHLYGSLAKPPAYWTIRYVERLRFFERLRCVEQLIRTQASNRHVRSKGLILPARSGNGSSTIQPATGKLNSRLFVKSQNHETAVKTMAEAKNRRLPNLLDKPLSRRPRCG